MEEECTECGLENGKHIYDCLKGHIVHNYKFSHQEKIPTNTTGCNETVFDVVVCSMCGIIKRSKV